MNRREKPPIIVLFAVILSYFLMPSSSWADFIEISPGDLDPTFGKGGKITTDFFGYENTAEDVAIQPDGRIIVVGSVQRGNHIEDTDFALTRYNADGVLDKSFGGDGRVFTDFFGERDVAEAVAVQPDGKILVVGFARYGRSPNFALARYQKNGRLDKTFGHGGKVTTDFFGDFEEAYDVCLQPDGKIVVAGVARVLNTLTSGFALARYHKDGRLDKSFGARGKVTAFIFNQVAANAVKLQSDGKIVVAGTVQGNGPDADFALARFDANGSLDDEFGGGGIVVADYMACTDLAADIAIQPDGKIIVAGDACNDFALVRYHEDGTLDGSFGDGGWVTTDFFGDSDRISEIALDRGGKIFAAGFAYITNVGQDFALACYDEDGSLDEGFGDEGKVMTDFPGNSNAASGVAVQRDGNIVTAGSAAGDFALARHVPDGQLRFTIQAEDYDQGGQNSAYFDKTPGNNGRQYRDDDVDIWRYGASTFYTGANATGEWLNYTIDVPQTGNYRLEIRVATPYKNRRVHVEFDGVDMTGPLRVANTGGWTTWQTIQTNVTLSAGLQVMRLVIEYGGLNIDQIALIGCH